MSSCSPGSRARHGAAEAVASYLAYRDHPAHRAVIDECITPIRQDRASIQYET